jgi:hypothetical protein
MRTLAALMLLALAAGPARADLTTVTPSALAPALGVYVEAIVRDRAAAAACARPDSPARNDDAWQRARASFVATLWAHGFAPEFIKAMAARLDAPATPEPAACADESVMSDLGFVEKSGWVKEIARVFSGLDIDAIANPVTGAQWQAIKGAVAADLPAQKRMLECIAVTYPSMMPVSVHDWDDMLARIAGKLISAGLPRDEVSATIGAAEANVLWHRAEGEAATALRASCNGDGAWSRRLFNFEFASLGADIDKLLPTPANGGDN